MFPKFKCFSIVLLVASFSISTFLVGLIFLSAHLNMDAFAILDETFAGKKDFLSDHLDHDFEDAETSFNDSLVINNPQSILTAIHPSSPNSTFESSSLPNSGWNTFSSTLPSHLDVPYEPLSELYSSLSSTYSPSRATTALSLKTPTSVIQPTRSSQFRSAPVFTPLPANEQSVVKFVRKPSIFEYEYRQNIAKNSLTTSATPPFVSQRVTPSLTTLSPKFDVSFSTTEMERSEKQSPVVTSVPSPSTNSGSRLISSISTHVFTTRAFKPLPSGSSGSTTNVRPVRSTRAMGSSRTPASTVQTTRRPTVTSPKPTQATSQTRSPQTTPKSTVRSIQHPKSTSSVASDTPSSKSETTTKFSVRTTSIPTTASTSPCTLVSSNLTSGEFTTTMSESTSVSVTESILTISPVRSTTTKSPKRRLPLPFGQFKCEIVQYNRLCLSSILRQCVFARRTTQLTFYVLVEPYNQNETFINANEHNAVKQLCTGYEIFTA